MNRWDDPKPGSLRKEVTIALVGFLIAYVAMIALFVSQP